MLNYQRVWLAQNAIFSLLSSFQCIQNQAMLKSKRQRDRSTRSSSIHQNLAMFLFMFQDVPWCSYIFPWSFHGFPRCRWFSQPWVSSMQSPKWGACASHFQCKTWKSKSFVPLTLHWGFWNSGPSSNRLWEPQIWRRCGSPWSSHFHCFPLIWW